MPSIEINGDNLLFEGKIVAVITAPKSLFRTRFIEKLEMYVSEFEQVVIDNPDQTSFDL